MGLVKCDHVIHLQICTPTIFHVGIAERDMVIFEFEITVVASGVVEGKLQKSLYPAFKGGV